MRSVWKAATLPLSPKDGSFLRYPRKFTFPPLLSGRRVSVYNGKKMASFLVRPYMVAKKISFFVSSRFAGDKIHTKRKIRDKKKKR